MSINKIVESDGHGAFYGLIGLSLAVFFYPAYEWLLPFITFGLGVDIDAVILRFGATSVFTALFYSIPLDRLIDQTIKYYASQEIKSVWFLHFPTQTPNSKLIRFITNVDFLTSTWRTPSWISPEDSLNHATSSAIDDPTIQREIWKVKTRSVIGFAFALFSTAFIGINDQINPILWIGFIVGLLLLFVPWLLESSRRLPTLTSQTAALRYAEDTFSDWNAMGNETNRQTTMEQLKGYSKRSENLISEGQWSRLERLYTWMTSVLERHRTRNYQIVERLYEVWARAIIEIVGTTNENKPSLKLISKYLSALNVLRTCCEDTIPSWAKQIVADDLTDLSKFLALPDSWARVDAYYPAFHHEILTVFEELADEEMKLEWANALTIPQGSQTHVIALFRFACQYSGSGLNDTAYDIFIGGVSYIPYEEVTSTFIDTIVRLYNRKNPKFQNRAGIPNLLLRIAEKPDIEGMVRERIIFHVEKEVNIRVFFETSFGINWRVKLRSIHK